MLLLPGIEPMEESLREGNKKRLIFNGILSKLIRRNKYCCRFDNKYLIVSTYRLSIIKISILIFCFQLLVLERLIWWSPPTRLQPSQTETSITNGRAPSSGSCRRIRPSLSDRRFGMISELHRRGIG